jgi:uncharacterized membrane protein HdeD (DUF308 family)
VSSQSPLSDPVVEQVQETARMWWLLLIGGLVSLVIGVLLLLWPSRTIEVIAILLGIELLLLGAIQLGVAFGESAQSRSGALLRGALAGIAGLLVIRDPGGSLTLIALAIGIYLVLTGVMKLVAAVEASVGRGWLLLSAIVDLAVGVVVVAWPHFGVSSLAVLVGIGLVLRGALESVSALALRALHRGFSNG